MDTARIPRSRVDKFEERRTELAEAALVTLSELGYAKTSLRRIAQNSEFSHGVLHYYFTDKLDLILCGVRQYKARCVQRYDVVTAESTSVEELMSGFLHVLAESMRSEARLHRLWYDLRAQALFDEAFHNDVAEIEHGLEAMIWRVVSRFADLAGTRSDTPSGVAYAAIDGLFQQALFRHLSGDGHAADDLQINVAWVIEQAISQKTSVSARLGTSALV